MPGRRKAPFSRLLIFILILTSIAVAITLFASRNPLRWNRFAQHFNKSIAFVKTSSGITLAVAVLGVLVTIIVPFIVARKQQTWTRLDRTEEVRSNQNRRVMLLRVRNKWVRDVREPSINRTGEIDIPLKLWPSGASSPALADTVHGAPGKARALFEQSDTGLLILGAPGSGKTIAMLGLARLLISAAQEDESLPMPVVFLLSSWANNQLPLDQWLVEEAVDNYAIPRGIARQWVETGKILPLLDGLDEVPSNLRGDCFDAIISYQLQQGPARVIICCRTSSFENLRREVELCVIELQELSEQQVMELAPLYSSSSILGVISGGSEPLALFRTPLFLNFVSLSQDTLMERVLREVSAARRIDMLLRIYTGRMLAQQRARSDANRYDAHQVILWLVWLARSMRSNNLTEFHVDRLKPDWVMRKLYRRATLILVALFVGCFVGLADGLTYSLVYGLRRGVGNGIAIGIFFAVFDGLGQQCIERRMGHWARIRAGVITGIVLAVIISLTYDVPDGLLIGSSFALIFAVFSRWLRTDPVEQLTWSSRRAGVGLISGGLLGAIVGIAYGIGYGLVKERIV